jgi:hypothetical protein
MATSLPVTLQNSVRKTVRSNFLRWFVAFLSFSKKKSWDSTRVLPRSVASKFFTIRQSM